MELNFTNSSASQILEDSSAWNFYHVCFLLFVLFCVILAVGGNGLVILSWFMDPSLRTPSNALLVSLALPDFLVGSISIPFLAMYELNETWIFGEGVCNFWLIVLWTAGFVSSNHLVLIAIDRYRIIREGISYLQRQTLRSIVLPVLFIWFASLSVTLPMIIDWKNTGDFHFRNETSAWACRSKPSVSRVIYTNFTVVLLPGILMLVIYMKIFQELKSMFRNKLKGNSDDSKTSQSAEETELGADGIAKVSKFRVEALQSPLGVEERKRVICEEKERRAAKTLGFLILAFIICWSPYLMVSFMRVFGLAGKLALGRRIPLISALLGWFNSCVNPIIYALRNQDFQRAFVKCLKMVDCRRFFKPRL